MGKSSRFKREYRTFKRKYLHDAESGKQSPSRHQGRAQSASLDPQEGRELVESLDPMAGIRRGLRMAAERDSEWAGIPMPLEGQQLVIEPTYPRGQALAKIGAPVHAPHELDDAKIRNTFWSWKWRSRIVIWEHDGKIYWGKEPGANHFPMLLSTLGAADAWSIECEWNAVATLAELVSHRQFKHYMLTGTFIERSKRSGVTYVFRRLRPTVAMGTSRDRKTMKILCAMCLHPIAYYAGTWAGSMVPTDDVIAHLMLMRGDEPMFWRRANQHPGYAPEAGI